MQQILDRETYKKTISFRPLEDDYPVTASVAAWELRNRGANASLDKLRKMASNKNDKALKLKQRPHRQPRWDSNAIDRAAKIFEENEDHTPIVIMCETLSLCYADYCTALKKAYDNVIGEFGDVAAIRMNTFPFHKVTKEMCHPDYFDMEIKPQRPPLRSAEVFFALSLDVREQLQNDPRRKKSRKR